MAFNLQTNIKKKIKHASYNSMNNIKISYKKMAIAQNEQQADLPKT